MFGAIGAIDVDVADLAFCCRNAVVLPCVCFASAMQFNHTTCYCSHSTREFFVFAVEFIYIYIHHTFDRGICFQYTSLGLH